MTDILKSWQAEKLSAYLYLELAKKEQNPKFSTLFLNLAKEAENQALVWQQKAASERIELADTLYIPIRFQIVVRLLRILPTKYLLGILSSMKIRGLSVFRGELNYENPLTSTEDIGKRHHTSSSRGNLRAAIFGVNDGLVSNLALIMGMAGANSQNETVLLAGTAGLLAGAFSMAAGEYVSVASQKEMFEYQIGLERDEMLLYPEEEAKELALIYEARGLTKQEADHLSTQIMKDPKRALDVLAKEELGVDPKDLGSPVGAAFYSFISFSLGAIIPLLPFIFLAPSIAPKAAFLASGLFLFVIGNLISLWTGKNGLLSGLRMLLIGSFATGITYLVGSLFGVSLS